MSAESAESVSPDSDEVLFDEQFLARLRRLVVLSPQTLAQGIAGEHRSKRKGSSPAFSDFKSYSHGDDFRRIDWNIYSRFDELFVRLSEVTTEQTVHFLLDSSDSMNWRSSPVNPTKRTFARRLVGAMGYAALWKFDRILVTPFGEELARSFGPVQGRSKVNALLSYLTDIGEMPGTNVSTALRRYVNVRTTPGLLFVVSDFLSCEPDDLRDDLHFLKTRGWDVLIIHIIDESELEPGLTVPRRADMQPLTLSLADAESREDLVLTPSSDVIERYEAAIATWFEGIEEACASENVSYIPMHTHWSFESLVLTLLYNAGVVA